MTTHRHALTLLSLTALASACDQPKPRCTVAAGDFAVRYDPLPGEPDCGLTGGVLSLQPYYNPRSPKDKSPDLTKVKLGLIPQALSGVLSHAAERGATPDPADVAYALGEFETSESNDDDYCRVGTLSTARVRIPAIPESVDDCDRTLPAEDAVDEQYDFSEVEIYVTPGALGTQLVGTLRYRNTTCAATYRVTGIYPAIDCSTAGPVEEDAGAMDDAGGPLQGGMDAGLDMDADVADAADPLDPDGGVPDAGEPEPPNPDCEDPGEEAQPAGPLVPDNTLCSGTGISPEFTASCDPVMMMCLVPPGKHE